ncbi:MAG: hypothetical protein ACPG4T_08200 [Nannocystaceae bacterium]
MGLGNEFRKLLTTSPLVAERLEDGINRLADLCEPLADELAEIEIAGTGPSLFRQPRVAMISRAVELGSQCIRLLPRRTRSELAKEIDEYDLDLDEERTLAMFAEHGIGWDSDVGRMYRWAVHLARSVALGARTLDERLIDDLEKRNLELATQLEELRAAASRSDIYQRMVEEVGRWEPPITESTKSEKPRKSERSRHSNPRTKTQVALGELLVRVAKQQDAPEGEILSRAPFSRLYGMLAEEGVLTEDSSALWARQLQTLRAAFDRSGETVGSIQRKTGLSADAIAPLVNERASPSSHVNSVVRLALHLDVGLCGIAMDPHRRSRINVH